MTTNHRLQRVVAHAHRPRQEMPDGEVMIHGDGVLQDITGSTYVRMTPDECIANTHSLNISRKIGRSTQLASTAVGCFSTAFLFACFI